MLISIKKMGQTFFMLFIFNLLYSQEYKIQFSHIPTGQGMGQNDSIGVMNSIGGVLYNDISSDSFTVGVGFLKTTQSVFSEPPVIDNFTFPDLIVKNAQSVSVSATIYDLNGINSAELYLQMGGSTDVIKLPMSNSGNNEYEVLIHDSLMDVQNFRARIVSIDNMGYSTTTGYKTPEIQFNNGELSMDHAYSHYPDGIEAGKWTLISWPGQPVNISLAPAELNDGHVFYSWKPIKEEFFTPGTIETGRSYWFKHTYKEPVVFKEDSSSAFPLENHVVQLKPGWNMIGSPFFFPVQFDKDSTVNDPITYGNLDKPGWSDGQPELNPWNGYAVFAADTSTMILTPFKESDSSAGRIAATSEWYLNLKLESETFFNYATEIGRRKHADNTLDIYDTPKFPDLNERISLLMDLNGNGSYEYIRDIRDFNELNGVWNLRLDGHKDEKTILLSGDLRGSVPGELTIAIVDIQARKISYEFLEKEITISKDSELAYDLKIVAGDLDFVARMTQQILDNIPYAYSLGQNYPNPFNPTTKMNYTLPKRSKVILSIYNVLGQEVITLINKEQDYGFHTVSWDGTDHYGKLMASGVYFTRMTTKNFSQTKKMLLLK